MRKPINHCLHTLVFFPKQRLCLFVLIYRINRFILFGINYTFHVLLQNFKIILYNFKKYRNYEGVIPQIVFVYVSMSRDRMVLKTGITFLAGI